MNSFEIGLCEGDDYIEGEDNRVKEPKLSSEVGLHVVMFALRYTTAPKPAAQYPCRIEGKEEILHTPLTKVKFTVLNADLQPVSKEVVALEDGYIGATGRYPFATCDAYPITGGYFKEYPRDEGDIAKMLDRIATEAAPSVVELVAHP